MPEVVVPDLIIESGGLVRCFRCKQYIGETDDRVELVGIGRGRELTDMITSPKRIWKCKCGWANVFKKP